jgi:two-component system sensor histidine kinase KdpD
MEDVSNASRRRQATAGLLALAGASAAALALRSHVAATNLAMLFLIGVALAAMRLTWQNSVALSVASVLSFNFFCVPPYYTFRVHEYQYLITFAAMLVSGLAISLQTARIRSHAAEASAREARTQALYDLSGRLAGHTRIPELARLAAEYIQEVFGGTVVIFLPEDGRITFLRRTSERLPVPKSEEPVAQWALDRREPAGRGCRTMGDASALYLPLSGPGEPVGVMAVLPDGTGRIPAGQIQLLEVLANQTAMAIERMRSRHAAESAQLAMETEQMRSSLLSAVSHDLRTPLASIVGAASTLRDQEDKLDPETRRDLLDSIAEEAERLSRLVSNLLDMTRLQSGVELLRDYYPLEEIVGAVLHRMDHRLSRRQVITSLPQNLPLVYADDVLLGQLLVNLLENAVKYTPENAPIEVAAEAGDDAVTLEVRDRGPGFAAGERELIFEKFYRGGAGGQRGAGLGLAICRAIAQAHGGTIQAANRAGGGAVFRVCLPARAIS